MNQAKDGDTVRVHYTGRLENGQTFGTSRTGQPIEFAIGSGSIFPAIENGIVGMEIGSTKTIQVMPEEAFGPRREELVVQVNKSDFPEDVSPSVGQQLELKQNDGNLVNVTVTDMDKDTVTLDANHPLAGNTLFFDIELIEIT